MKVVVVSQPMYLPWIGLFDQIRLSDVFVHYDNVQMPLGRSFISRVQLKTASGTIWLTVPIKRKAGQLISEVEIDDDQPWRHRHLNSLAMALKDTPYRSDALEIAERQLSFEGTRLAPFLIFGIETISSYLGLSPEFRLASTMVADGRGTDRLVSLVEQTNGTVYLTGHGAANYLDHAKMEARGIEVRYIDYAKRPYPQRHGAFMPYVTVLDAIASLGRDARALLSSETVSWREFLAMQKATE